MDRFLGGLPVVLKERELIGHHGILFRHFLFGKQRHAFLVDMQNGHHKVRRVILILVLVTVGFGARLQLPRIGVVGAGDDDRLTRGREKRLQQGLFIRHVVKHLGVEGERLLPVFLRHEGEQPPQLRQKLLFIDRYHLRKGDKGPKAVIIDIIAV